MTFHECCNAVIAAAKKHPNSHNLQYAATYAKQGLRMDDGSELARVQAMYIISNLGYWRGPQAKLVKASLKHHGGHGG